MFRKDWYKNHEHPRGMLGKKHSEETKRRMSIKGRSRKFPKNWGEIIRQSKLGKPRSEETKRKISETRKKRIKEGLYTFRTGSENNFWNDGASKESKILRNRKEYHWWREAVFARDNWTCQECGARSKKDHPVYLQAHHIKPFTKYPELRYAIDNGKTLCIKCH